MSVRQDLEDDERNAIEQANQAARRIADRVSATRGPITEDVRLYRAAVKGERSAAAALLEWIHEDDYKDHGPRRITTPEAMEDEL